MEERKRYRNPAVDICEDDGKVVLRVEMPGVDKENLDVQIENNELIISGLMGDSREEGSYLVRERVRADYRKIFTLDDTIDRDKVSAKMEHGILHLELHMKEAVKPRKITIG